MDYYQSKPDEKMIHLPIFFSLILFLISDAVHGQSGTRIQLNMPTSDEEADYVWETIRDILFFEQNNYTLSLPKGRLIELLKEKSRENSLSDHDFESLRTFMRDSVFNSLDYEKGYKKIEDQIPLINKMISEISQSKRDWNFREFDTYQVRLTLYGPGGTYDPDEGFILIYTTPDGGFKMYDEPANTIIHEIVHIGIQESIVDKYEVPHALKERIVDKFVFLNFKDYLPEYRIQNMGDERIDPFLKTKQDLKELEKYVMEILE